MITIDQTIQSKNIGNIRAKRLIKKETVKAQFNKSNIIEEAPNENAIEINPVNPFLFLQEIGEYKDDQEKLKEAGNKILNSLNDIKFGLMNGELHEEHIIKLKKTLEANKSEFKFPELQNVIDDIILRSEVELAKIELTRKKP